MKRDLKIQVLWDMKPCSKIVKRYRCFGRIYCLHLRTVHIIFSDINLPFTLPVVEKP